MKRVFNFITILIFLSVGIMANNQKANENNLESWYVKVGFGVSFSKYYDDLEETTKKIDMDKGISKNFNLLSAYFTFDSHLLLGAVLFSGGIDNYEKKDTTMDVYRFHLAASAIYFLKIINNGFFVRGDLGLSKFVLHVKSPGLDTTGGSNWGKGFSVLLGGGYALPVTDGSSLMFEGNLTYKAATDADDADLSSSAINIMVSYIW